MKARLEKNAEAPRAQRGRGVEIILFAILCILRVSALNKDDEQQTQQPHVDRSQQVIQRHAPATRQALALADRPGLDDVEDAEEDEDCRSGQQPTATQENLR